MKTRIIVLALLLCSALTSAQQDSQYTQYMYNTVAINPAYAGSRGMMSIFGLYRTQWVGLEGAPKTALFSLNSPIGNSRLGYGVGFVNDKIGPTDQNTASIDLSYTVQASETLKLSAGLKGSANFFSLDVNKLDPGQTTDQNLNSYNSKFTPNIGAGVYLHGDQFYAGFSVPSFLQKYAYDDNNVKVDQEKMHLYFIGGYVFNAGMDFQIKPAVLFKAVQGAPLQADLSLSALYLEKLSIGAAYRWDAAWSAMAGFQVTDGIMIGYAYDRETTALRNFNSGSHEVYLRFELFTNYTNLGTPRFF